jgi:hypothetical protein
MGLFDATTGHKSHVYMFICFEGDQWLVKIGVSDTPMQRLQKLRTDSPFPGRVFAVLTVANRKLAFELEAALLSAFFEWRTRGEWIQFPVSKKREFNAILRRVLEPHRTSTNPLRWEQHSVEAIDAALSAVTGEARRFRPNVGRIRRKHLP